MAYEYLNDSRSSQDRIPRKGPGLVNPNNRGSSPEYVFNSDLNDYANLRGEQ